MKKENGFTLVEIIGVITIIAIISLIALPPIINQITKKKSDMSATLTKTVEAATNLYIDSHKDLISGYSKYCIKLGDLVDGNYLDKSIYTYNNNQYTADSYVSVTVSGNGNTYDIVSSCEQAYAYIKDATIVYYNPVTGAKLMSLRELKTILGLASTSTAKYGYLNSSLATTNGVSNDAYAWLYNYTNSCTDYGCNVATSGTYGYWLDNSDVVSDLDAYAVLYDGTYDCLTYNVSYSFYGGNINRAGGNKGGIRPVITISKTSL